MTLVMATLAAASVVITRNGALMPDSVTYEPYCQANEAVAGNELKANDARPLKERVTRHYFSQNAFCQCVYCFKRGAVTRYRPNNHIQREINNTRMAPRGVLLKVKT